MARLRCLPVRWRWLIANLQHRWRLWRGTIRPVPYGSVIVDQLALGSEMVLMNPVAAHVFSVSALGRLPHHWVAPGVTITIWVSNRNAFALELRIVILSMLESMSGEMYGRNVVPFPVATVPPVSQVRIEVRCQKGCTPDRLLIHLPTFVDQHGNPVA